MNLRRSLNTSSIATLIGGALLLWGFWNYVICATVLGPDEFLVLTRKYGFAKPPGQILAQDGQRGVLETTLGTGRHFINPILYEVERKQAVIIGPTEIGIVSSKAGNPPKDGNWLAERGERGTWREVLSSGVHKLNPVAYKITVVPMTRIPPGYVGVLTNTLTSKVEEQTLPPGLHKINTQLYRITIVDVGVRQLGYSQHTELPPITDKMLMEDDESDAVLLSNAPAGGAIGFPSRDGFNVGIDASIIFEIEPQHGVRLLAKFGDIAALTERIIDPALRSVTRNVGSTCTAKQIIQGETRIEFQHAFTAKFFEELAEHPVKAIDALPRALYVPLKIQLPIMKSTLKQELKLTNKEIEQTAELQSDQERARKEVDFQIEKVRSEADYEVSAINAEMMKNVAQFRAETQSMVAEVKLKIARIEAETRIIKSQGDAEVVLYAGEKKAELIRLKAKALGSQDNLVYLGFVEALPDRIPFQILHSGEGTMWTDIPGLDPAQTALIGKIQQVEKK